jgi:hypothetical protein
LTNCNDSTLGGPGLPVVLCDRRASISNCMVPRRVINMASCSRSSVSVDKGACFGGIFVDVFNRVVRWIQRIQVQIRWIQRIQVQIRWIRVRGVQGVLQVRSACSANSIFDGRSRVRCGYPKGGLIMSRSRTSVLGSGAGAAQGTKDQFDKKRQDQA